MVTRRNYLVKNVDNKMHEGNTKEINLARLLVDDTSQSSELAGHTFICIEERYMNVISSRINDVK